jgi:hypothetical protein
MAEIKWILTCNGECPYVVKGMTAHVKDLYCPKECPRSYYEKEQLNTEVIGDE